MSQDRDAGGRPPGGAPPEAGAEALGSTRFGGTGGIEAPASERPFAAGTRVRVTRLRARQPGAERTGDLGSGRLVEEPSVGSPLRVELETGPALVTSPVRSLVGGSALALEVITTNSSYRIEKLTLATSPGLPPRASALAVEAEGSAAAPNEDSAPPLIELDETEDGTRFIPLNDLVDCEASPFGPGAKVRILRRKPGDRDSRQFELVGTGQVLDPLTAGEPARFGIDGGLSFVTSRIRSVRLLDGELAEFETANTLYRLEKIEGP